MPAKRVTSLQKNNKIMVLYEKSRVFAWPGPNCLRKTDQLQSCGAVKAVEQVPESQAGGQYYCTYSGFWAPDERSYESRFFSDYPAKFQRWLLHPYGRAAFTR